MTQKKIMGYTWAVGTKILTICILTSAFYVVDASLETVSKDTFLSYVKGNKYLLTLFYYDEEDCPRCVEASKEMEKVTTPDLYDEEVMKVKCEDPGTAVHYGINTVPQIIFFRNGVPALYDIPDDTREIRAAQLQAWLEISQQVAMQTLTDQTFEHLTQASTGATTGDWLVIFYRESCQGHLPAIEGAGVKIKHKMNTAKVNVDENPDLAMRFGIKECPTTYYFRHGKMYLYDVNDPDQYQVRSLISFVTSWHKNVKAQVVPKEPTAFDRLTEAIADYIKEQMNGPNRNRILLACSVVLAIVAFTMSIILVMCTRKKDTKTE